MEIDDNTEETKKGNETIELPPLITDKHVFAIVSYAMVSFVLYKTLSGFSTFLSRDFGMTYAEFTIINEFVDIGSCLAMFIAPMLQNFKTNYVMSFLVILSVIVSFTPLLPNGTTFIPFLLARCTFGCAVGLVYAWAVTGISIMP